MFYAVISYVAVIGENEDSPYKGFNIFKAADLTELTGRIKRVKVENQLTELMVNCKTKLAFVVLKVENEKGIVELFPLTDEENEVVLNVVKEKHASIIQGGG
jgi:hypothetical protein